MTTSYLGAAGRRLAYDLTGEGPLVVCVPGMGELRSSYRFLAADLATAGFRVASLDLRGHGDSDDGFDSFDDEAAAADILALIDELGGPALVVGNSMGAGAAVIAAAERPDSVAGLVLVGPFVRNPPGSALGSAMLRLSLLRPWGPAVWRAYHRSLFPGALPADFAEQREAMGRSLARHWRSFQRTTRTTHEPAERRLGAVTAPVLVVMGSADRDWKDPAAEADWIKDRLAAEVLLVDGSGHYPMVDAPQLVGPAVVGFARTVTRRA
jgi:pimeloyl-ACP methyl ester carboxylesterase